MSETPCNRCGHDLAEADRAWLAYQAPGSTAPDVRPICGACASPLAAWFGSPSEAEALSREGLATAMGDLAFRIADVGGGP